MSPFSTNGALVLANAQGVDREAFFRKLMAYGALVTVVAPIVVWVAVRRPVKLIAAARMKEINVKLTRSMPGLEAAPSLSRAT